MGVKICRQSKKREGSRVLNSQKGIGGGKAVLERGKTPGDANIGRGGTS